MGLLGLTFNGPSKAKNCTRISGLRPTKNKMQNMNSRKLYYL